MERFADFIAALQPYALLIFYGPPEPLSASEQIDQAVMLRDAFGGRWPGMG